MRLLLAAVIALAPVVADAQARRRPEPAEPPASTLPLIGLPLGPMGLPLPQIGLPLPAIGLAPPGTRTESAPAPPPRSRPPRGPHRKGRSGPTVIYVVPAYPWGLAGVAAPAAAETVEPAPLAAPPDPDEVVPPVQEEPDVAQAPIPRKPFYFIPGCYLGDVPPKHADVPTGCDPGKAVVVLPQ